jgi:hypothetical protein
MWFARRGYMVVAPSGSGYGAAALDDPERGLYSVFYSKSGGCDNPNFHDAGLAVALVDKLIIDYMTEQKLIVPDQTIVVGQSGGARAVELECTGGPGHHLVCRGPRRTRRRQAQQQLRAGQTRCCNRRIRAHRARADVVDLHRERHLLRAGLIEENAPGLYRGGRQTPNIACLLRSAATGIS